MASEEGEESAVAAVAALEEEEEEEEGEVEAEDDDLRRAFAGRRLQPVRQLLSDGSATAAAAAAAAVGARPTPSGSSIPEEDLRWLREAALRGRGGGLEVERTFGDMDGLAAAYAQGRKVPPKGVRRASALWAYEELHGLCEAVELARKHNQELDPQLANLFVPSRRPEDLARKLLDREFAEYYAHFTAARLDRHLNLQRLHPDFAGTQVEDKPPWMTKRGVNLSAVRGRTPDPPPRSRRKGAPRRRPTQSDDEQGAATVAAATEAGAAQANGESVASFERRVAEDDDAAAWRTSPDGSGKVDQENKRPAADRPATERRRVSPRKAARRKLEGATGHS